MIEKQLIFIAILISVTLIHAGPARTQTLLTIGDSNGASAHGWVVQLQNSMPDARIINRSFSGNTIGFDNNGQAKLNTLRNIDNYITTAINEAKPQSIDKILICLGTNDCKAVYADSQAQVPLNMRKLITVIRERLNGNTPAIIIISPPPYGPDSILPDKYKGGMAASAPWPVNLKKSPAKWIADSSISITC